MVGVDVAGEGQAAEEAYAPAGLSGSKFGLASSSWNIAYSGLERIANPPDSAQGGH
jgi:hypothetical protein